jgi:hypothetical protein
MNRLAQYAKIQCLLIGEEDKEEWEKTGNHYDIQSILDKMKENEVKKC